MIEENYYTESFFKSIEQSALHSAQKIIPLVMELLQPNTVIDVGCGLGTWLSVFKEHGVEDILGIDGDYVERKKLQIPEESFLSVDLKKPLTLDRKWDLVVSLEVAEHLPDSSAEIFVNSLAKLGKVILFSAAIPFQEGENHLNEQWQDYWKKHFENIGYLPVDCIRRRVWQNSHVAYWYAQNILIYVEREYLENHQLLKQEFDNMGTSQLAIVHPEKYLQVVDKYLEAFKMAEGYQKAAEWHQKEAEGYKYAADPKNMSLKKVLSALPIVTLNGFKRTIKNFLKK